LEGQLTGRTALGYGLVVTAVTMFALNASLALFLLDDGVSAMRLSELRTVGALVLLILLVVVLRPKGLRIERSELPTFAVIGIAGLALVYVTYFVAIERLGVGPGLTLEYLAPLLLLLWLRVAYGRRLSPSLWAAVALSLVGSALVVRAWDPTSLDALGVLAGLGAAVSFAIYFAGSERAGQRHTPLVTLFWAFAFSTVFWLVIQPPWSFPFEAIEGAGDIALAAAIVVIGTLVPFGLIIAALRHVPAACAAAVATLEPALSALFAFLIHDETLAAVQLVGIAIVLSAVAWVQLQRPDMAQETIG
jgi:drug/metabolite transporter (DMT)-like permease